MTKDERAAISILNAYKEGYESAIEDYKQEPCDDAISRAELYKAIDSWDKFGYTETGCFVRLTKEIDEKYVGYIRLEDVITAIQGMPSVQPSITTEIEKSNFSMEQYKADTDTAYQCGYERGKKDSSRKGHWIYRREDKYSCSKCGTTTRVDESGIDEKPMYKFCPYCGADMRGDTE